MGRQRKLILCGLFIFMMSLSFISGCVEKVSSTAVIFDIQLKAITNGGEVCLADGSFASTLWVPKSQETVLSEVTSWLQQAKQYKGIVPELQFFGAFAANISPSALYLLTSDKHHITIQPVWYFIQNIQNEAEYTRSYLPNVLVFTDDEKKTYIQSIELYNWLKNDKWQTEFKMKE